MGLDNEQNIYLAVKGGLVVKKITPDGVLSSIAYSSNGWSPTGGLFDDRGNLWLFESNITNETRVRKITKKELSLTPLNKTILPYSVPIIAGAGISILLIVGIRKILFASRR
jgi:hypothetical protein